MTPRRCADCRWCRVRFVDMLSGRTTAPDPIWNLERLHRLPRDIRVILVSVQPLYYDRRIRARCARGRWQERAGQERVVVLCNLEHCRENRVAEECSTFESMDDEPVRKPTRATPERAGARS